MTGAPRSYPVSASAPEIWTTCEACGGEGSVEQPRPFHDDPYFCITVDCERCGGSGWELD